MNSIKRIVAGCTTILSLLAINPIGVNAEWRLDSTGWWYAEGNSYPREKWELINGKWYYFDYSGYLVESAWIYDGYYVNSNGEWTYSSKYRRPDIINNAYSGYTKSGKRYFEAGDKSTLNVINGEPCIYAWDENDQAVEIGMNTLNIYDIKNNNIIDKLIF